MNPSFCSQNEKHELLQMASISSYKHSYCYQDFYGAVERKWKLFLEQLFALSLLLLQLSFALFFFSVGRAITMNERLVLLEDVVQNNQQRQEAHIQNNQQRNEAQIQHIQKSMETNLQVMEAQVQHNQQRIQQVLEANVQRIETQVQHLPEMQAVHIHFTVFMNKPRREFVDTLRIAWLLACQLNHF